MVSLSCKSLAYLNVLHHPSGELPVLPGRFVFFERLVFLFLLARFLRAFLHLASRTSPLRLLAHRHRAVSFFARSDLSRSLSLSLSLSRKKRTKVKQSEKRHGFFGRSTSKPTDRTHKSTSYAWTRRDARVVVSLRFFKVVLSSPREKVDDAKRRTRAIRPQRAIYTTIVYACVIHYFAHALLQGAKVYKRFFGKKKSVGMSLKKTGKKKEREFFPPPPKKKEKSAKSDNRTTPNDDDDDDDDESFTPIFATLCLARPQPATTKDDAGLRRATASNAVSRRTTPSTRRWPLPRRWTRIHDSSASFTSSSHSTTATAAFSGGSGNSAVGGTINSPLLKFDDALYEYLLKNTREPRLLRELERKRRRSVQRALECKYLPNKGISYV